MSIRESNDIKFDLDEVSDLNRFFDDKRFIRSLCFALERTGTLYALHIGFVGLIDIAWCGSYHYLALVIWVYYLTDKDLVKDVNYDRFKPDFSQCGFSAQNILTYSPLFKELCGDLEHLSLLGASVPLSDPRMNMLP